VNAPDKKIVMRLAIQALAGWVLLIVAQAHAEPVSGKQVGRAYVEGEVLVKFRTDASSSARDAALSRMGPREARSLTTPGWTHVKLSSGATVEQTLAQYGNDSNVEVVQPNYIYHLAAVPNDTSYGQQWALKNTGQAVSATTQPGDSLYATNNPGVSGDDIDIPPAWDVITDCSSVTVAVIDTGVNYNHGELAANMWNGGVSYPHHGYNFVDGNNDPMDRQGHGTHVAGTIGAAGNNGAGIAGVCWTASIMAVRVLDASGTGTTATITQGVNFAVTNGAKVINMSLGGSSTDPAFSSAITSAQSAGVVMVVAAGNDAANNDTTSTYPCNYTQSNLLCVAALDQSYRLATFSNYGATNVDIGAPGTNVLSAWAGTNALISDNFASGWTYSSTTSGSGGGWSPQTITLSGASTKILSDPAAWSSGTYNSNTDDRAYKAFNLSGVDVALWQGYVAANVINGDTLSLGYKSAGGDPFGGGGTLFSYTNLATYPYLYLLEADVSGCIGATCTIGFQLQSGAVTPKDKGAAVAYFTIQTLALNTSSYNTINGTSMATPHVAGLATMLQAFNPSYTYTDVINAIKNGGRSVTALAGITTTGKAIDAMGALAYINAPTGLAASVQ